MAVASASFFSLKIRGQKQSNSGMSEDFDFTDRRGGVIQITGNELRCKETHSPNGEKI